MTQNEFKAKLIEAFGFHVLMKKRNKHTVNELLYTLRYYDGFGGDDFNISIRRKNGEWWTIHSIDSFVSIPCLSVWFEDEYVEFEVEQIGDEQYNCITIYESEGI